VPAEGGSIKASFDSDLKIFIKLCSPREDLGPCLESVIVCSPENASQPAREGWREKTQAAGEGEQKWNAMAEGKEGEEGREVEVRGRRL